MKQSKLLDSVDKIKYNLVFNLFTFFFVGVLASVLFLVFTKEILVLPNILALVLFAVCLVTLKVTKNFTLVAYVASSLGLVLISYVLLYLKASQFLSPMWMILNIVFSFFIINRFWGGAMLIIHFSIYFYFTIHVNIDNVILPSKFSFFDTISFLIQLFVVSASLGYILFEHVRAIRLNEERMKSINTELIEKNNLISQQNKEMEVMLREIHHRVKNNLQIISSMLRLQSEREESKGAEQYKEAIDRISAIAMIHDKMYRSESLSMFDMKKYVLSLSENLLRNYALVPEPHMHVEVNIGSLHSKTIVPIAILLNELLLNSIKHAFNNQPKPEIRVKILKSDSVDYFHFQYSDNGLWKKNTVAAFGSEIIEAMVEQLDGETNFETNEKGTHYSFKFKYLY